MRAPTGARIGTVIGLGMGLGLGLIYAQIYIRWKHFDGYYDEPSDYADQWKMIGFMAAAGTGLGALAGSTAAWLANRVGPFAAAAALVLAIVGPFVAFGAVNDINSDHATPTLPELVLANVAATTGGFLIGALLGSILSLFVVLARRLAHRGGQ